MPKGLLYRLKFLECLWNSFLKMLLDHLNPSFFKKQNKTKQDKANKAKRKQGCYYSNRVEIRIGYIIVKQMHHQLLGRINFRLKFFAATLLKNSWSNCPTFKYLLATSIESNSRPRHYPQIGRMSPSS